jgi:hypothetical protein
MISWHHFCIAIFTHPTLIASGKKGLVAAVVVPSCELIFLFILIDLAHLYCPIGNSLERSDVAIKVHTPNS